MEKRRSSFPFSFRRYRPESPESITGRRTLDTLNSNFHAIENNKNNNTKKVGFEFPRISKNTEENNNNENKSGSPSKKNVSVFGALFNVIPVISLTSADNVTVEDPQGSPVNEEPEEVITILPA